MSTTVRFKAPFASTLPGRYYYDPANYAQEQACIFGKMWVYACRADALSELVPIKQSRLAAKASS